MNFRLLIFCLIAFVLIGCKSSDVKYVKAEKGIFDFSDWNFYENGILKIKGDWEFYYMKLYNPTYFTDSLTNEKEYLCMPSNWGGQEVDNHDLSSEGYATLRLTLIPNPRDTIYSLKINRIDVAYNIWINGTKYSGGKVGKNFEETEPECFVQTIDFITHGENVEIIAQISGFHHRKAGITTAMELGPKKLISKAEKRQLSLDFFLIGIFAIMAIYHFGLFVLYRIDYSTLYFAFFTLFVALHQMVNSQIVAKLLFENLNWELIMKINFWGNYLRVVFYVLFVGFMFKDVFSKYIKAGVVYVGALMSVLILFTPARIYTYTLHIFEIYVGICAIIVLIMIFIATLKKLDGAFYSLIGTFILTIGVINDILYEKELIDTMYIVPIAVFIFIFLQSFMISIRFSKAYKRSEALSEKLNYVNQNLEEIVHKRTKEIEMQKEEIQSFAENLQLANSEISAQKKEIEKTNKDITDSINYAKRIQTAVFPNQEMLDMFLPNSFILFKPRDVISGDFYYLRQLKSTTIFAVGDCTGHGVPGAFMSMLGIAILNEIFRNTAIINLGETLNEFRKQIKDALNQTGTACEQSDGIDIALCAINLETMKMRFAGANNPCWIFRNPEDFKNPQGFQLFELPADRQPIGVFIKESPFSEQKFQLEKDDIFYLFSDGFPSQFGSENNQKFKTNNLRELLSRIYHQPLNDQKLILENTFENWKGNYEQTDDVLVVGVKI